MKLKPVFVMVSPVTATVALLSTSTVKVALLTVAMTSEELFRSSTTLVADRRNAWATVISRTQSLRRGGCMGSVLGSERGGRWKSRAGGSIGSFRT